MEEDEEEDVEEHEEDQMPPEPCAVTTEPVQKEENEREEEDKEGEEEGLKQEAEHSPLQDPVEVVQEEEGTKDEENDQSEDSQTPSEPAELSKKEEESTVTGRPLVLVSCYLDLINMSYCYTVTRSLFLNDVLKLWKKLIIRCSVTKDYNQVIISDAEPICQEIQHETVIVSTNGITNGEESENGTGSATNVF